MKLNPNDRLMITGASGMVGSALIRYFLNTKDWNGSELEKFVASRNIIAVPDMIDLRNETETGYYIKFTRPSYIIHLAARVGGVKINTEKIGDFYTDNIRMNTNVLRFAHEYGVKKVLSFLSTCVYPDKVQYPLKEENIHSGPPHPSNYTYAYTKRMLDVQSRSYRQQFGDNFITAIPNNIFGINDNFDLNDSHVIPALIRKIYEAKQNKTNVSVWGNGSSLREFTFSDDMAKLIAIIFEHYNEELPINIGSNEEYSIRDIVELIAELLGFDGEIKWDASKPAGQHRKLSSTAKFRSLCGNKFKFTPLANALKIVCDWFAKNYPNVRGIK